MREELQRLLNDIAKTSNLDFDLIGHRDTGDGFLLAIPQGVVPPQRVVDVFIARLSAGLREHARIATPATRLRLRVAFDIGLVERDSAGWTGPPLVRVARLVDAEETRNALRQNPQADFVVVLSDPLYREVVRQGFGDIDPDAYRQVLLRAKEFDGLAWLLVPGEAPTAPAGPGAADESADAGQPPEVATQSGAAISLAAPNSRSHRWMLALLAATILAGLVIIPGRLGNWLNPHPTATASQQSPSTNQFADGTSIAIVNPRPGYSVDRSESISGTVTKLSRGMSVWLIVKRADRGRFVPTGPCDIGLNTWVCSDVQIGGALDANQYFDVFAVVATTKAAATLANYRAAGLETIPNTWPMSKKILLVRR